MSQNLLSAAVVIDALRVKIAQYYLVFNCLLVICVNWRAPFMRENRINGLKRPSDYAVPMVLKNVSSGHLATVKWF